MTAGHRLPPGQVRIEGFPRFGPLLDRPPPAVRESPSIEIGGAVVEPVSVPLADLAALPRRSLTADFHCVAGWSAQGITWEGITYESFHRVFVVPALAAGTTVTHVVFERLDGYRSITTLDDALGEDVLLADLLDGEPLSSKHGAPIRLLSPDQYGYVSTKHLCRIGVHDRQPRLRYHRDRAIDLRLQALKPHGRANVWREERHRYLPAWFVRPIYRRIGEAIKRGRMS